MTVIEVDPPAADFRPINPQDLNEEERLAVLGLLGLAFPTEADPELDRFADEIIEFTGAAIAGVNRLEQGLFQRFPGMSVAGLDEAPGDDLRSMDSDHGFCTQVVTREAAMAVNDVSKNSQFATNPVVEKLGIRSYIGAPLWTPDGKVFGTVWGIDKKVQNWTQTDVDAMKAHATKVSTHIRSKSTAL